MSPDHDHLLATLARRLLDDGVPPDDVDAAIADELRVPRDHYVAYLLVWGALETYRHAQQPDTSTADGQPDTQVVRRPVEQLIRNRVVECAGVRRPTEP